MEKAMPVIAEGRDLFIDVYERYYGLIYSTAYAKLGDADDAMDAAQEVFIRFHGKLHEVREPRTWLYGTLRNVVFDMMKKKKPDLTEGEMDDLGVVFVNGFRDTRLMIKEALESEDNFIDENDRALFELVASYDFTYREAGAQLGMSERQAKYRFGLAVRRLTEHFRARGITNLEELL
jgi:RNA polymerase sigma-70 factor, ECF subfamily